MDLFVGLAVGLTAVAISFLQWQTARYKLALEAMEKRLPVFQELDAVVGMVAREAVVTPPTRARFISAYNNARFLFGRDVEIYLDRLRADLAWLESFTVDVIRDLPDSAARIEERVMRLSRVVEGFGRDGLPLFQRYMRFTASTTLWPRWR